jgi:hypothetical protein
MNRNSKQADGVSANNRIAQNFVTVFMRSRYKIYLETDVSNPLLKTMFI